MHVFYFYQGMVNVYFLMALKPWVEYAIVTKSLDRIVLGAIEA